ncbi:MAG: glycosyltransferase family 2 protein [Bacteroidales bacterium]|nr:glycosyltransferase family 2 protein [Bacteroidales bacterium]
MQSGLVSILTPMYNTERYVHRLLDSVLSQDYPWIEMLVVDDGSTDGSRAVVEAYRERFAAKGYSLRYLYQDNSGQSAAIKNGLPRVTGEYLAWPDSDDFYASEQAISKMVATLAAADEAFQLVRTQVRYVEEKTLRFLRLRGADAREEEDRSLFRDCLFGDNGFYYCAGSYLVRTEVLKALTDFDIYTEKNAGQNWQLLLPVLYEYRCKTILEPLYTVVERSRSHSRGQYSAYIQLQQKNEAFVHTQLETLKRIKGLPEVAFSRYKDQILAQKDLQLLNWAIKGDKRQVARQVLPDCKTRMGKAEYALTRILLQLPGGTRLFKAYRSFHHCMYLLKKRLMRLFVRDGK